MQYNPIGFLHEGKKNVLSPLEVSLNVNFSSRDPYSSQRGQYVSIRIEGDSVWGIYQGLTADDVCVVMPSISCDVKEEEGIKLRYSERPAFVARVYLQKMSPLTEEEFNKLKRMAQLEDN